MGALSLFGSVKRLGPVAVNATRSGALSPAHGAHVPSKDRRVYGHIRKGRSAVHATAETHRGGSGAGVMILTLKTTTGPDLCAESGAMKKNMGDMDRTVRIILALAIGGFTFAGVLHGVLALILLVLAVVLVLTSFVSFCPLYAILGISTCKK